MTHPPAIKGQQTIERARTELLNSYADCAKSVCKAPGASDALYRLSYLSKVSVGKIAVIDISTLTAGPIRFDGENPETQIPKIQEQI